MKDLQSRGKWEVFLTTSANKQRKKLPESINESLADLIGDLEQDGPIQKGWAHYSPLKKDKNIPANSHHCHIRRGRPTYVACWLVQDKKIHIIEIYYVGTHENAPY